MHVDIARAEWEAANEALEREARDRTRYERLLDQVEAVTAELRKRVGQTFTVAELVRAYDGAEPWARGTVAEHAPAAGWSRDLSLVTGAAFHQYARGAVDYEP